MGAMWHYYDQLMRFVVRMGPDEWLWTLVLTVLIGILCLRRTRGGTIAARGAVESARTAAEQTLYQTAADQRPDSTAQALQQQIEQVKARISERRPVLQAEELIVKQRGTLRISCTWRHLASDYAGA